MNKRNIAALVVVIILVTSIFTGCKQSGKNGDFYPYKLSNYVTLGDYLNANYKPAKISVTDEDVDDEIRAKFKEFGLTTMEESTE